MQPTRTPAWLVVRLELMLGIGLTVVIGLWVVLWTPSASFGGGDRIPIGPLEMPASLFVPIMALVMAVVGLIWMVRIFRGPRDEPPPWRYRDL
jgi:hypothetical protein